MLSQLCQPRVGFCIHSYTLGSRFYISFHSVAEQIFGIFKISQQLFYNGGKFTALMNVCRMDWAGKKY